MQSIIKQFISSSVTKTKIYASNDETRQFDCDLPVSDSELFDLTSFPLLDKDHAISRLGSDILLYEMLQLMVNDELANDISAIKKAHKEKDWETIELLAHKMKGGAVYCGTYKMQYACQYLERYRKAGHTALLEPLYQQLLRVLYDTEQAIRDAGI